MTRVELTQEYLPNRCLQTASNNCASLFKIHGVTQCSATLSLCVWQEGTNSLAEEVQSQVSSASSTDYSKWELEEGTLLLNKKSSCRYLRLFWKGGTLLMPGLIFPSIIWPKGPKLSTIAQCKQGCKIHGVRETAKRRKSNPVMKAILWREEVLGSGPCARNRAWILQ